MGDFDNIKFSEVVNAESFTQHLKLLYRYDLTLTSHSYTQPISTHQSIDPSSLTVIIYRCIPTQCRGFDVELFIGLKEKTDSNSVFVRSPSHKGSKVNCLA